jgi:hypothetical protein
MQENEELLRMIGNTMSSSKMLELYYLSVDPEFSEAFWRLARLGPKARHSAVRMLEFLETNEAAYNETITREACVLMAVNRT